MTNFADAWMGPDEPDPPLEDEELDDDPMDGVDPTPTSVFEQWRAPISPIVVASSCGGGGASVVAAAAAAAAALYHGRAALVDGTAGGDGPQRCWAADGARPAAGTWQDWMRRGAEPDDLSEIAGRMSADDDAPVYLLPRDPALADVHSPLGPITEALMAAGVAPVVDVGRYLAAHTVAPLWALTPQIVIAVPARAGGVNALRPLLTSIEAGHVGALAQTTLVVTEQAPGTGGEVADILTDRLAGRVGDILVWPYDRALAAGLSIARPDGVLPQHAVIAGVPR